MLNINLANKTISQNMIEEGQLNKTLFIRKCFKIFNSHLKVNKLIE
jgi:hypothetical protein